MLVCSPLRARAGTVKTEDHAGDRGVDAGGVHGAPGCDRERDEHPGGHAAPADQDREDRDRGEGRPEPRELQAIRVEDRDDHDPEEVVDHGEREQEGAQRSGQPLAEMVRTATAKATSVATGTAHPAIAPPALVALTSA